jgi:4-aminobutyrate aminotransferase-like enzyme
MAQRLRQYESPNVTYIAPDFPIFWERAQGCCVIDVDGNRFLDMTSAFGVSGVGHCHPRVVDAIQQQAPRLLHGMGDVHPSDMKVALCQRIAECVPILDAQVILGQNGSDAIEAALKTAAIATKKSGVLAFEGGYHGLSYGALDVTSRQDFRAPFQKQLGHFTRHLPYGCEIGQVERILKEQRTGAVLVEPIQGRGGIIVPPKGWLRELRHACTQNSVLLIFDEIFTGWGRTGDWFACEFDRITPDILCIGKAMGGGLPISACVATKSLMATWGESQGEALHTSTFLGNPLACAAALAAISVINDEELPSRAKQTGNQLLQELAKLQNRHSQIVEVRGRGLMIGIEMADVPVALHLVSAALQHGLIILPAGDGRVLEFIPPLVITESQILWFLNTLDLLLSELP